MARSTWGLTSPIISSIERIAAWCGVLPTLNEKQMCTGAETVQSSNFQSLLACNF